METAVLNLIWLFLYGYCIEGMGTIQKGRGRRIVAGLISLLLLALSLWIPLWSIWLLEGLTAVLFVLFFDEEPLRQQWKRAAVPALLFACLTAAGAVFGSGNLFPAANGIVCLVLFLLLAHKRGYLRAGNAASVGAVYVLLSAFPVAFAGELAGAVGMSGSEGPGAGGLVYAAEQSWPLWASPNMEQFLLWGIVLVEVLLFFALEGTLFSWQKGFERSAERFQQDVLTHQYEEIRTIYTNMRGWRHDYHNHLQVIKAQLALGETDQLQRYLDELEQDLDRVDSWIKSGNLMADAILNSKLSLAQQKRIRVNCKARLPENLPVEDVDLCVILGNLLDNALEACEQIPEEGRFLRVYLAVNGRQLYMSIQNSAKEELNFNERNYITQKRGSHGFGMKRVSAVVEKYDGFLNLANEPGIFAAEVTLPLAG